MYWTVSGEAVIWTIVGGTGTLLGPIVGAAALTILREELSTVWEHYLIVVGVIVILMVTFAPKGILGSIAAWRAARRAVPGDPAAADGKGTRT
jgi:branched-chain amino acid transport system permease protein